MRKEKRRKGIFLLLWYTLKAELTREAKHLRKRERKGKGGMGMSWRVWYWVVFFFYRRNTNKKKKKRQARRNK